MGRSEEEMTKYFKEPVEDLQADPSDYWRRNQERFPALSKLAKKHLCTPVTSVPSERVFSDAGLVVNKLRNCLWPQNVHMLLFLKANLKYTDIE